jgi:hypothetical protein
MMFWNCQCFEQVQNNTTIWDLVKPILVNNKYLKWDSPGSPFTYLASAEFVIEMVKFKYQY